ncbi:hypothetical protein [Haloarcula amylolytica]|uniref:hypothetical protein n=1 Tax=Haloarcula amylolytica TaxID=396317 RepID=UPI001266F7CA|nr:hypothetical protein [Haloarcula amylolytica]
MLGKKPPLLIGYLNQSKKSISPLGFINHFMDTDPWWIDPERNQPQRYVLNSQDRLYCAHGDCGSYNEAKLIERIRDNRIKEFPERIQDLIDDIMLVHYSDQEFLDSDEWDQLWKELIDVDQRSDKIPNQNILTPIDSSNEAQFGFELGRILGLLTSADSPVEPLIWGILQGILASGAKDVEGQIDVMEYMILQFENRIEERRQEAENIVKNKSLINESSEDVEERMKYVSPI